MNNTMGTDMMQSYMHKLWEHYKSVQGKTVQSGTFWDIVIISARDYKQEQCFQMQLSQKEARGELPLSVSYRVMADPESNCVAGSGGSTLHILKSLYDEIGTRLESLSILIIHSGGYSKRMPNHSCLGKIFAVLPIDGELCDMLDIKLAFYLPFLKLGTEGKGGVFVTASDDIETYTMKFQSEWISSGINALAHLSPISTGKTHGVFVVPNDSTEILENESADAFLSTCVCVLQKPMEEEMLQMGALLNNKSSVLTDSAFWMDSHVVIKMLTFYKEEEPLEEETCIYGDFMQAMGTCPYISNKKKRTNLKIRINQLMHSIPLNLIVLPISRFYHLGSMEEALELLHPKSNLFHEINLTTTACSNISHSSTCVCMHSFITPRIEFPQCGIIEFCDIKSFLKLGNSIILSHCEVPESVKSIPEKMLFHSVPIRSCKGSIMYVTVAFQITDDLKNTTDVKFIGKHLSFYFDLFAMGSRTMADVFPENTEHNLWNAKLFPKAMSRKESFLLTMNIVESLSSGKKRLSQIGEDDIRNVDLAKCYFSMADIINQVDVNEFLLYRHLLCSKISTHTCM